MLKYFKSLILCILLASFCSCKYDLITAPTVNPNDTSNINFKEKILPPEFISASHGQKGTISINWSKVDNAFSYKIYEGNSPFEIFNLYAEVSETEVTLEYDTGTSKYFAISAVNYYGTESLLSKTVMGSTMAAPVITNIEPLEPGKFELKWWMDNCSAKTYEQNVLFTIKVYKDNSPASQAILTKTAEKNSRSIILTGLTDALQYYFEVEAKLKESTEKPETSGKIDAKSARKVTPEAVTNLNASKGTLINGIELSFTIPSGVWRKTTDFELYPVYFVIYKKAPEDTNFTKLTTIGAEPSSNWNYKKNSEIHFNCDTETANMSDGTPCDYVTIKKSSVDALNSPFESYIPQSTITYTDKDVENGKEYIYYIRSYTDNVSAEVSDNSSISSETKGWTLPAFTFNVSDTKHLNPSQTDKIESIEVSLKTSVTDAEKYSDKYSFVISRGKGKNDSKTEFEEQFLVKSNTLTDISDYRDNFTSPTEEAGYYNYYLYIIEKTDSLPSNIPEAYIQKIPADKIITISDSLLKLPAISDLSIRDGFADHFEILWKDEHFEENQYELIWIPFENGAYNTDAQDSLILNKTTDIKQENDSYIYKHQASSGVTRAYFLSVTPNDGYAESFTTEQLYSTLGTPDIQFTEYNHHKIVVTWKKLPCAKSLPEDFIISAHYNSTPDANIVTSENTTITFDTDKSIYTCTITKPNGYDNYRLSGLPISLSVTASSEKTSDKTTGTKTVKLLGPAEIESETNSVFEKDKITFSWTEAEGANKYIVQRVLYSDSSCTQVDSYITYLIDAKSLDISESDNQTIGNRASCTISEKNNKKLYTLTDYQKNAEESFGYHLNQAKIQWGLPFSYVVIPLTQTESFDAVSFNTDGTDFKTDSTIKYAGYMNNTKKITSTIGYGLNVHAAKSESGSKISITWEKPNDIENLQPVLFRKSFANQDTEPWSIIKRLSASDTSCSDKIDNEHAHLAYLYSIEYEPRTDKPEFVASYIEEISKPDTNYEYPSGIQNEPNNKGYLFSIEGLTAQSINTDDVTNTDYFQESLRWNPSWDFTERAICPDSFTVDIKNKNLSRTKNWIPIATVNIDKTTGSFSIQNVTTLTTQDDITVIPMTSTKNGVNVKPTSLLKAENQSDSDYKTELQSEESTGLLTVLRDTKHYYSLNITGNGKTDRQADDESIYAYRQVTDIELVKCVSIIIADALYQISIPTFQGAFTNWAEYLLPGANGSFRIGHFGGVGSGDLSRWGFDSTEYIHKFITGTPVDTKILTSEISLYSNLSGTAKGIKGNRLYHLPSLDITINHSANLSSYSKTLTYIVGKAGTSAVYNLSIKKGDTSIVNIESNYNDFMKYFPYWLDNDISANTVTSVDNKCPIYMIKNNNTAGEAWKIWWN